MFENIIDRHLVFNGIRKKFSKAPQYIVLHHTAVSAEQTLEQLHKYHIEHNGWIGIGYNAVVDKAGNIFWGRGIDYVGAHCKGYNTISIGICAIGNMEKDMMPAAQKESIVELIKEIKKYYPKADKIVGHKQLSATTCPGKNYPLAEIIKSVEETESEKAAEVNILLKQGDRGSKVSAMQSRLVALGYDLGYIDAIFGPKTEKALTSYQKTKRLNGTGNLDDKTNAALIKDVDESALPQLGKGNRGGYVKMLQRLLNARKQSLNVDGIFGDLTKASVLAFQKQADIEIDGIVGPKTWHMLLS